jgi:hypothetical protein
MEDAQLRALYLLLLLPGLALANPMVVCDPYPAGTPQPDSFSCQLDTAAAVSVPATRNADGSVALNWDVGPLGISNGSHKITCIAVASASAPWGNSDPATLSFVKALPNAPGGLRLIIR